MFFAIVVNDGGSALTAVGDTAIWLNEESAEIATTLSGLTPGAGYRLDLLLWNDDQPFDTGLDITVGTNPKVNFALPAGTAGGPRIESFCFLAPSATPVLKLTEGGNSSASPVISSLTISEQADITKCSAEVVRPLTLTANNQSVAFLTDAPAAAFYTYTVTDASGATVTPTFTTAPTCTSSYFVPAQALSFPITCSGAASAGDTYTYADGTLSVTPAPLTVTYTGASGVITPLPATLSLSATLAPYICAEVGTVTYTIAPDPTTGTGSRTITNGVSTTGWLPGVYAITATYAGNSYCGAASDVGVLTVASPSTTGDATTGGGQYVGSTSTQSDLRVNFGHTVQTTSQLDKKTGNTTRTYRGNLLWMVTSGWRLNGSIASTTVRSSAGALVSGPTEAFITTPCPAGVGTNSSNPKCGEYTGTGVLQQYDPIAKNWKTATQLGVNGTVSFKATIYDGGSVSTCKGKTCSITDYADSFGLTMTGVTKTNGVPVGVPALLLKSQNGSIVIR